MAGNSRKAPTSIHQGMMMRSGQRSEYNDNLLRINQREENRLLLELEQWERAQRLTSKGLDKESQWFRQKQSQQTGPRKHSLQETCAGNRDMKLVPDYHFSRAYSNLADANGLDNHSNGVAAARKEGHREEGEGPDTNKGGAGRHHTRRTSNYQRDEHRRASKHGPGGHRKISQPHSHQGGGQQRLSKQPHSDTGDKSKSDALESKDDTDVKTHVSGRRKGDGDITTITTKDKGDDAKTPHKVPDPAGLKSTPSSNSSNATTTSSGKTAVEQSSRPNSSTNSSKADKKKQRSLTTATTTTTSSITTTKPAVAKTPETITSTTMTSVTSTPGGAGLQWAGLGAEGLGEAYDAHLSWDGRRRYANVWDTLSTPKNFSQVRSVRERLQREFTQSSSSADSMGRRRPGAPHGSGGRAAAGEGVGALNTIADSKKSSNTPTARRSTKTAL